MRAFGYTPTNEIDQKEAAIVRELAVRVVNGEPLHALVKDLHERGIATSNGGRWDRTTIRSMLRNPRITGRPTGVRAKPVPAILSEDIFKQIAERLDAPERRINLLPGHRQYLMSGGRLVCGRCGKSMGPKGGAIPAYVCISRYPTGGCGRMRIVADRTDLAVTTKLLARIALPESGAAIKAGLELKHGGPERMAALRAEISSARQLGDTVLLTRLSEQLDLVRAEWTLVANMQDWFADLANITPRKLAQWWTFADLYRRQAVLAHMMETVKVLPVGRIGRYSEDGVSDRLEFAWN